MMRETITWYLFSGFRETKPNNDISFEKIAASCFSGFVLFDYVILPEAPIRQSHSIPIAVSWKWPQRKKKLTHWS